MVGTIKGRDPERVGDGGEAHARLPPRTECHDELSRVGWCQRQVQVPTVDAHQTTRATHTDVHAGGARAW